MAEIITLTASPRTEQGTRPSRRLRAQGHVPAVVYGLGTDPQPITVQWRELRAALITEQGLNAVIHLELDGRTSPTLVKDMQRHPVRRDVLHVDFLRVDLDKPVDMDVPLVLEGEAIKVAQGDGMVEQVLNTLVVTGKPDAIPGQILVDVSDLEIGDAIRVGDLQLPEDITTSADPEEPVVMGQIGMAEEELEPAAEDAEAEEGEEPEAEEGDAPEADAGDSGDSGEGGD